MNQVVVQEDYVLPTDEAAEKFEDMTEHEMMEEIVRARRIAARIFGVRLGYFERVKTFNKTSTAELDMNVKAAFMASLVEPDEIHEIKIIGALLHPLYQNEDRMIAGGLCNKRQYDAGKEELLDRIARHYERKACPFEVEGMVYVNEWEKPGLLDRKKTPRKLAEDEYDKYLSHMKASYLPRKMEPVRVLGAFTADDDPRPNPVYAIGPVIEKGQSFMVTKGNANQKCNHANFIDKSGHYDLMSYLDLLREECPAIYEIGRGLVGSHVSSEVDCESLFSQADLVADSRRSCMDIRFYERLVMAKHRLGRVYCHIPDVVDLYMKRWRENDWKEAEERDANEFLELEKEIYLEKFPRNKEIFFNDDELKEEEEEVKEDLDSGNSKRAAKKKKSAAGARGSKKKSAKKRGADRNEKMDEEEV